MESPEVAPQLPEQQGRYKTMQTLHAPSGNIFEYCLDSDESDCEVNSDIAASAQAMNDLFSYFNDIFSPKQ